MIRFDEAVAIVTENSGALGVELVPLGEAHGRVLAQTIEARVNAPPCDVSAMDGYAVREEDLLQLPARLRLVGESFAGTIDAGTVDQGCCIRIFTGAPVPRNADRVVIQEMVRRDGDFAIVDTFPGAAKHIRRFGSDFKVGAELLKPGKRLGYRQLVLAAGSDLAELEVWRQPKVIILGTGDELAAPGTAMSTPGAIPESVSFGIAALAEDWGGSVNDRIRLCDDLKTMEKIAAQALERADLLVVTGGASVGEKDFAKAMFASRGLELLFSKVSIKPGKPVWLGRAGGKLVMGLPGNPTSALVTARLLLAPLVAGLSGLDPSSALRWRQAQLLGPLPACGDRETFTRARSVQNEVEPMSNQDSSSQLALAEADLLVRRRSGAAPAEAGEPVWILDF